MMNRRICAAAFALLVTLALAAGAGAQPIQDEVVTTALTGEVTVVDTNAKSIRVEGANGEKGVFYVDDQTTTIMYGSQKVGLADIAKGEWVAIDANLLGGKHVATLIQVVEDPNGEGRTSPALPTAVGATIEVRHDKLSPDVVQISAGHSVIFHNVDKMAGGHTVVSDDGSVLSPALDQGQEWSHSFDVPGTYRVHIKEHPGAKATIVVEAGS